MTGTSKKTKQEAKGEEVFARQKNSHCKGPEEDGGFRKSRLTLSPCVRGRRDGVT